MTPDHQEPQAPQQPQEPQQTPEPLAQTQQSPQASNQNPSNIPQPVPPTSTQSYNPYATPPPTGTNKGLIIGLVAGGLVLVAAIVLLVLALTVWGKDDSNSNKKSDTDSSQSSSTSDDDDDSEDVKSSNNDIAANTLLDFSDVCTGAKITNAAAYDKNAQSKIASFYQSRTLAANDKDVRWLSSSVGYGDPYYADSKDLAAVSVVACLSYVSGSEQKELDCDYTSSGATVTVAYYSSKFKLTYIEAKTGKKIKDNETISAPATRCPSFVSYNKTTLRAYATPDDGSLKAALLAFK